MIRLADWVVGYLEEAGIQDIFTVAGGGSAFLGDALTLSQRIKYHPCHHEQAASMAAEAYARAKDDIGVSIVTTGPGCTNAITGVGGAWTDSVPHLTISGQVFLNQTIGTTGVRQLGVQEINIVDLVKPVTKYAVMVTEAQDIRYHLEKAIYLAKTGRPGPTWLDLPANIQNAKIDPSTLRGFTPDETPLFSHAEMKDRVREVVALLKNSTRPMFHVGQGVHLAGASDLFFEIVEKYEIPFVTARNANDLVDWDHPLYVGRPGTFAQRPANFAVQNADFYLAVGTRLNLTQTGYQSKDYARAAKRVMVDIDRHEIDKPTLSIDIKVHADAKAFLVELAEQMKGVKLDTSGWKKQCQEWRKQYPIVSAEQREQKGTVNSYHLLDVMSDLLTRKDTVVTDMGFAFQNTHQALRMKRGQKVFTNCGFAAMGWGLPAAVGASLARGRGRTLCITGDGGLMMNIQEMATVMHEKLPVKIIIFNNGGYLTMKQTQEAGFGGRLMGCNEDSGLSFPDFRLITEAHRFPYVRLENHDGLKEKLAAFLEQPGPGVCEVMMDHDQPQTLRVINRRREDGTTESTPIEDLYPFLDKSEVQANMSKFPNPRREEK